MNVTCTGCPAKYAVPDEKVRGKKVRITCKHCGTNIIVDGTVSEAAAEASPKPAAQATATSAGKAAAETKQPAQAKAAATPSEVMFIVGFADDRQETHTIARIVELYSAGKIDDETLVWKDGMADWLSPFDVPELAAAFRAKNVAPRAQAPAVPAFMPAEEDDATLVVKSPLDDPEVAAAIAASAPSAPPTAATGPQPAFNAPKPVEEEPMFAKPAAARRTEKRPGGADLFGKVAEAGSEGDVSLDLGPSEDRGQKLTGARNESSVLFSLDALTKADTQASPTKAKEREREASEMLFGESAPNSLMNLGGGGLNAMSAPDFTKPVVPGAKVVPLNDSVEEPSAPSKGRGGVILLVAFLAIAAAAAVAFVMMKKQQITAETTPALPSASAQATTSAEPAASEAPAASNAPAASGAPAASASAASTAPLGSTSAAAS
ncbi:MAG TPA: zinc-ribbon domain-containing protein, partial [Polyangiaceae bacterium]|nr:zinc-ribbon domain-containing protein [Polyangiaceae bacterium]